MTLKYANEEGVATALADVSEDGLSTSSIVSTDVDGALTNPYWIGIMETADPGFGVGNLSVTKVEDGSAVMFSLENQSNTADSSGRFDVRVAGASAGDPYVNMDISGVGGWSFGVDNSDDDTFKIDHGGPASPGSNTYFSITTGGICTFYGDVYLNQVYVNNQLVVTQDIITSGNLICDTANMTLKLHQGDTFYTTPAVMVAGTVDVTTSAVNTGDFVHIMKVAAGGVSTVGMPVVTITDGVKFTITGDSGDTSSWAWYIVKKL